MASSIRQSAPPPIQTISTAAASRLMTMTSFHSGLLFIAEGLANGLAGGGPRRNEAGDRAEEQGDAEPDEEAPQFESEIEAALEHHHDQDPEAFAERPARQSGQSPG